MKPGTCFPLTAALSLDQACLRCLLVTRGHTGLEPHTLQFLRPLVCLEALLRASALAASVPSPVSVLRPYPGLLPQLTHCLVSLPVFLPHHQSVCLHLCRQDNLTVGNSDHYTTLLKIPQDLTKLLIKETELSPASYLLTDQPHNKALSFLKSQCHSIGFCVCWAVSPLLSNSTSI